MNHSTLIKKIAVISIKAFFYLGLPVSACLLASCVIFSPLTIGGYLAAGIILKIACAAGAAGLVWTTKKFHFQYNIHKQDLLLATLFAKQNLPVYDNKDRQFRIGRGPREPDLDVFNKNASPIQQLLDDRFAVPIYLIKFRDKENTYLTYLTKSLRGFSSDLNPVGKWRSYTRAYDNRNVPQSDNPVDGLGFWNAASFEENFTRLESLVNKKQVNVTQKGSTKEFTLG